MTQALWFLSRATGLVSLLLLTATMVLGATTTGRVATTRWPRFTLAALHRNLSLLAVVFLAVHIAGAVIDPYASIAWVDAIVPFISTYQPFWLGLGALALDLLIAVGVSSLLRMHIGARVWRAIHWGAYAMFPLAVAHGLGIAGSDLHLGWVPAWFSGCVLVVIAAVWLRLRSSHPDTHARASQANGW